MARPCPSPAGTSKGGIAVSGPGAEYLVANPNNEGSAGFHDRNEINPLQQLIALSGKPSAFTYTPANSPTGQPVSCTIPSSEPSSGNLRHRPLLDPACGARNGLQRSSGNTVESLAPDRVDNTVDYSYVSSEGRLAAGKVYKWDGWIYVPVKDAYVFRIQHSTVNPRHERPLHTR